MINDDNVLWGHQITIRKAANVANFYRVVIQNRPDSERLEVHDGLCWDEALGVVVLAIHGLRRPAPAQRPLVGVLKGEWEELVHRVDAHGWTVEMGQFQVGDVFYLFRLAGNGMVMYFASFHDVSARVDDLFGAE